MVIWMIYKDALFITGFTFTCINNFQPLRYMPSSKFQYIVGLVDFIICITYISVLLCHEAHDVYIIFFHLSLIKTYPHTFPDHNSDSKVCWQVDLLGWLCLCKQDFRRNKKINVIFWSQAQPQILWMDYGLEPNSKVRLFNVCFIFRIKKKRDRFKPFSSKQHRYMGSSLSLSIVNDG